MGLAGATAQGVWPEQPELPRRSAVLEIDDASQLMIEQDKSAKVAQAV